MKRKGIVARQGPTETCREATLYDDDREIGGVQADAAASGRSIPKCRSTMALMG